MMPDEDERMDEQPLFDTGPNQHKKQLLETCRIAYDAGVPHALYISLSLCREWNEPVPTAIMDQVLGVLEQAFGSGFFNTGKGGPHCNPLNRYRDDIAHFARWEAVEAARKAGANSADLFADAAELMEGTAYAVGEDAMRNSYRIIEKALDDPSQGSRLFFLTHPSAKNLGLDL